MPRSRKATQKVLERMKELRKEGLTYREIAEKTSLSRPSGYHRASASAKLKSGA